MMIRAMIRAILGTALSLLLTFQLASCGPVQASESISVAALAMQIEQGNAPLILDVRTAEEYADGHIPGALNIYFKDIPNQLDTIRAANRDRSSDHIILYCERGIRAGVAENLLTQAGFTSVIQLTGDLPAWRAADLPIATDSIAAD